jgi:hypothetical protein
MQNFASDCILGQAETLAVSPSEQAGYAARGHRGRRVVLALPFLVLTLVAVSAASVAAHTDSPGSLPLKPYSLRLQYRRPADIVALFSREQLPDLEERIPRAARIDSPEAILPGGTEAIYRSGATDDLVIVATEGSANVEACIRELDVPVQQVGPDQVKVVLTLRHASPAGVRAAVLRLPGAGSATASGKQIALTGKPTWLHRALRSVIRAEFRLPELAPSRAR